MTAAAKPPARETRKPDFPAVVHTYTDALRLLRDDGPIAASDLAERTARDPSNMRRDLHKLADAGVIEPLSKGGGKESDRQWKITDKGRRWVDGADVAEGRAAAPAPGAAAPVHSLPKWPIDQLVANPTNRRLTAADIDSMADSIAAQGILQPLTVSPPDDAGFRTIWIGHRRWRGAERARAEGRLPAGLADGLPFVERAATPAEAIAMTVIENVERQDIPPLELAFLLDDYAKAAAEDGKPLDAKSVAEALGLGVRDVQDKIRIARHATPEAIAEYERTGSWDQLRASVTEKRTPSTLMGEGAGGEGAAADQEAPPPEDIPSEAFSEATQAAAIERAAAEYPENQRRTIRQGNLAGHITEEGERWPEGPTETLTPPNHPKLPTATIHLSESSHGRWNFSTRTQGGPPNYGGQMGPHGPYSGDVVYRTRDDALRAAEREVRARLTVNKALDAWLNDLTAADADDPLVVNGVRHPNLTRANEARRAAGILPNPSNHGGGSYPKAADSADPNIRAMGRDWDRMRAGADVGGDIATTQPASTGDLALLTTSDAHKRARLALIEIAHKIGVDRRPLNPVNPAEWAGDVEEDFLTHGCTCGAHWLDPQIQQLIQLQAARVVQIPGGHPPMLALTEAGLRYLLQYGCALPLTADQLVTDQKIAGVSTPPSRPVGYATPALSREATPPPAEDTEADRAAAHAADMAADQPDPWDRTPEQIEADQGRLQSVLALEGTGFTPGGGADREAFAGLGVVAARAADDGGYVELLDPQGRVVTTATVDVHGERPDEPGDALAILIARAINAVVAVQA